MSEPSSPRSEHLDIDHEHVLDDELEVEPPADEELPEHLDLPIETPEADAIEQQLDAPPDDDDRR